MHRTYGGVLMKSKAARIRDHKYYRHLSDAGVLQDTRNMYILWIVADLQKYGVCRDDVLAAQRSKSSKRGRPPLEHCPTCGAKRAAS